MKKAHMTVYHNKQESSLSRRAVLKTGGSGSDHRIDGFGNA
jgi:hypothetical protein